MFLETRFSVLTQSHTHRPGSSPLSSLNVPFDRQSGSSHLRALDYESALSEWITEAFASEACQTPGDTVHKHRQAPSEHLPKN